MPYLGTFRPTLLLPYLNSTPPNFSILASKLPYFDNFGLEFEETITIFEINHLQFIKNEFVTNTVNFDTESGFSKGTGSNFFAGPIPFYKVYGMPIN